MPPAHEAGAPASFDPEAVHRRVDDLAAQGLRVLCLALARLERTAVALRYENGVLVRGATRGNGRITDFDVDRRY